MIIWFVLSRRLLLERMQLGVLGMLAVTVIAGCGGSGHGPSAPPPSKPTTSRGTLSGMLVLGGGPALAARASQPGEVIVLTMTGSVVASQHVPRGQSFAFQLSPGRYLLSAIGNCPPEPVRVRPQRTTHAAVGTNCAAM